MTLFNDIFCIVQHIFCINYLQFLIWPSHGFFSCAFSNSAVVAFSSGRVLNISTSHLKITRKYLRWTLCIASMWRMRVNPGICPYPIWVAWGNASVWHCSVILLFWEMTTGRQNWGYLRAISCFEWVYVCCNAGTRSLTSLERMKGWEWKIWKGLEWLLESHLWLMRRLSPWTW